MTPALSRGGIRVSIIRYGPERAQGPTLEPGPGTRPWGPGQGPDFGAPTRDPALGPGPWGLDQGPDPGSRTRARTLGPGPGTRTRAQDLQGARPGTRLTRDLRAGPGTRAWTRGPDLGAPDPWPKGRPLSRPPGPGALDFRRCWAPLGPGALPNASGRLPRALEAHSRVKRVVPGLNGKFLALYGAMFIGMV